MKDLVQSTTEGMKQRGDHPITERRDDESVTQFNMRRVRAEIIEECAEAVEWAWPFTDRPDSQNDAAIRSALKIIRGLKDAS